MRWLATEARWRRFFFVRMSLFERKRHRALLAGPRVEAVAILAIVVLNAAIGLAQEGKAVS
jgi:hypothetical protein